MRSVDPAKIVLIEPTYGDTSIAAADFANLTHRDNIVWSIHDYFAGGKDDGYAADSSQTGNYPWDGTSGYPSPDPNQLERHLLVHVNAMRLVGTPIWIGEFGIGAGAVGHDPWITTRSPCSASTASGVRGGSSHDGGVLGNPAATTRGSRGSTDCCERGRWLAKDPIRM